MIAIRITYDEVIDSFHSNITDRFVIPPGLEERWFLDAVEEFELELFPLHYDPENCSLYCEQSPPGIKKTLGLLMYVSYLTKELSRVMKLNGIVGKDLSVTGSDGSKRVTKAELDSQKEKVREMLDKFKRLSYGMEWGE